PGAAGPARGWRGGGEELGGDSPAGVRGPDADPHVEVAAARHERADLNGFLVVFDQPRLPELEEAPPVPHLVDAHRHAAANRFLLGAEDGGRSGKILFAQTSEDEGADVVHTRSSSVSGRLERSRSSRVGAGS